MIELKIYVIPIAALIPLIIGAIWYNPKVLGTVWMKEAGINDETMKGANMGLIFGLSYLFACLMGFALMGLTVHELGFQSMIMNAEGWNIEGSELMNNFTTLVDTYAPKYRTFGHGALHGLMGEYALPLLFLLLTHFLSAKAGNTSGLIQDIGFLV